METGLAEIKDNIILQQLLPRPRYFDPGNDSWANCSWCGQEGHMARQCTTQKGRKPCLRCGSLKHRRCRQRKARKKDQGNESQIDTCLRCGNPGHDMFSCSNDYSPDDLKEIQCYVCRNFGHLCCREFPDLCPSALSCYRCGESGHLGSYKLFSKECPKLYGANGGSEVCSAYNRCREQGHIAPGFDNHDDGKVPDDLLTTPLESIITD